MSWWQSLSMSDAAAVLCFVFVGLLAIVPPFFRKPRNRRRDDVLGEPSDKCRRSPDWRSATLDTPRKYIP